MVQVGHAWRTTKDISMEIEATWADVLENLDETAGLARFAGPGGWNDADMLEASLLLNVSQNYERMPRIC